MPSLCAGRVGRRVGRSAAQHRRERRRFVSTSAAAAAALAPLRAVGRHLRESPEGVQQLLRLQPRGCSLNERSIYVVAVPHQWPASPRLQPRAAAPPSPAPPVARRRRAAARGPIGSRAEDQLIRTSSGRPTAARGPRAAARRRRRRSPRAVRPPRHRRRAAVARAW